MKCNEVKKNLMSYLDGKVDKELRLLIEEHLNQCSSCREQVSLLSNIADLYKKDSPFPLPHGLKDELTQLIKKSCKK
ncbi:zf-HC2 domain-containing protein [candidate division WOR-3 bacterium]|jgi:predicted anti-sigma-YlaC factor YlaD|uniref:Putative zinc-finger domain-containing protein n=1 Tax=candidate division TA06 bacterium TaxID=2250710 RepID=A0A660S978_UNCT6|nr:zf-HC2 domain-containing protein [candidate division WOR-3 bacterium]RKX65707.1 MAG: hypothetical protein DRP44_05700 [candidate division TA06 bacterium]HHD82831.1 zf-HC2 domain-containing protein [Bacteroidota bacterium]